MIRRNPKPTEHLSKFVFVVVPKWNPQAAPRYAEERCVSEQLVCKSSVVPRGQVVDRFSWKRKLPPHGVLHQINPRRSFDGINGLVARIQN